jgi:ParB-like chromosome segregation protein Spo0J
MTSTSTSTVQLDDLNLSAMLRPPNAGHVRALIAVIERVPPILVHRHTNRVLDGHMRVAAAKAAGLRELPVEWIDDEASGWLRSVEVNAAHGLPLTAGQRAAAARQVLALMPGWSNRRIAELCGVDEATVRRARAAVPPGAEKPHPETRLAKDGSRHHMNREQRREEARRMLTANAGVSNAEVARRVGLSPTTVAAVRRTLPATPLAKRRLSWGPQRRTSTSNLLRTLLTRGLRMGRRLVRRLFLRSSLRR